jgi:hypothetical protein
MYIELHKEPPLAFKKEEKEYLSKQLTIAK